MFKYISKSPIQLKRNTESLPIIKHYNEIEKPIHKSPCRIILLPVELQIRIFVFAQNPSLAIVCKQFYKLGLSDSVRAEYLIQRYGPIAVLGKQSMSRRIVSLGVVEHILRLNYCNPKADGEYWLFTQACELNQINLCRWIIQSALSMEKIENEKQKTLTHLLNIAAFKGTIPVIDVLVDMFHVDIHQPRGEENALTLACRENYLKTAKHLILKYGCDVHGKNEKLLRDACLRGQKQLTEFLLSLGSDVHVYGDAALQNATYNGHSAIVKLLLDAGANASTNQNVCIRHAITKQDIQSVNYLISAGADPRYDRDWPLRHACRMGFDEIVVYLINVIPDAPNIRDGMPLKESLINGRISTIKILLAHGANPNISGTIRGLRHILNPKTKNKNKDIMIKILMEAGLDLSQQSDELNHLLMPAISSSSSLSDSESKTSLTWI